MGMNPNKMGFGIFLLCFFYEKVMCMVVLGNRLKLFCINMVLILFFLAAINNLEWFKRKHISYRKLIK